MAIEINWTWGPLRIEDRDDRKGVIVGVDWRCVAMDAETNIQCVQSGVFLPPYISDEVEFVELDVVTKDMIQAWIDERFHVAKIEAECKAAVESQTKPQVFTKAFPV